MIDPTVLRAMQAAGASIDVIIAAVEADVAIEKERIAEKRQKDAERQQKSRINRKLSRNVTVTPRDTCDSAPLDDNISNPPGFDVSDETSAVSSFQDQVVDHWNSKIDGTPLPTARKLIGNRLKHLRCRAKERGEDAVFTAIDNMIASDFHSGRSGRWLEGNLGWLLKSSDNFDKMLERTNAQPPTASPSNLSILSQQAARYRQPQDQAA